MCFLFLPSMLHRCLGQVCTYTGRQVARETKFLTKTLNVFEFCVVFASYHRFGAWNFEVTRRPIENLFTFTSAYATLEEQGNCEFVIYMYENKMCNNHKLPVTYPPSYFEDTSPSSGRRQYKRI